MEKVQLRVHLTDSQDTGNRNKRQVLKKSFPHKEKLPQPEHRRLER